jgi:hypothetical protein
MVLRNEGILSHHFTVSQTQRNTAKVIEILCFMLLFVIIIFDITGYFPLKAAALTEHHVMKAHWGVEVCLHAFLTSALDGGGWSASRPGRFIPRERAPGTHWIGGWVGPRASLDAVVRRKLPSPCRDSNP